MNWNRGVGDVSSGTFRGILMSTCACGGQVGGGRVTGVG